MDRKTVDMEKKNVSLPEVKLATASEVFENCNEQIVSVAISISKLYYLTFNSFLENKRKALKNLHDKVYEMSKQTKDLKDRSYEVIVKLQDDKTLESSLYYVQVVDAAYETGNSVLHIYKPVYEYVDNNNTPFSLVQAREVTELNEEVSTFLNMILHTLKNRKYENTSEDIRHQKMSVLTKLDALKRKQFKRIKRQEVSTGNSMLYLNILTETKNLILFTTNLVKANRNFYRTVSEKQ